MLTKLIGQTLDGKYYLDKLLGQGGMGAVFLATHLGTKRPVALKVIAPQFTSHEEVGERFRREAEAAGRLRSPPRVVASCPPPHQSVARRRANSGVRAIISFGSPRKRIELRRLLRF